jgi:hypothetical protein
MRLSDEVTNGELAVAVRIREAAAKREQEIIQETNEERKEREKSKTIFIIVSSLFIFTLFLLGFRKWSDLYLN